MSETEESWSSAIGQLNQGHDLEPSKIRLMMREILSGRAQIAQIKDFLPQIATFRVELDHC